MKARQLKILSVHLQIVMKATRKAGIHGFHPVFDDTSAKGVREHIAVLDRAHSILGWQPQVSLEAGIGKTVQWMQSDMKRSRVLVIYIGQVRVLCGAADDHISILHN